MAEIDRGDALALMAEEKSDEIWDGVELTSAAMSTFNVVPMGKREKTIPFVDVLPATPSGGPFINGDTGIKPQYDMSWALKTLTAEEIAGIVPIPENVLDDADVDLWAQIKPKIDQYVALAIDAAVFSGINAPASWPTGGLVNVATLAGNVLDYSTYDALGTQAEGYDLAGAFSELLGLPEEDGFETEAVYVKKSMRRSLRNLRNGNGDPIYSAGLKTDDAGPSIWGTPMRYVANSTLASNVRALAADPRYAIIGKRSDMEWKLLDQATLTRMTTVSGTAIREVAVSLAEQDMLALRFKIRLAFNYMDPTTIEGGSGASPFAVMVD